MAATAPPTIPEIIMFWLSTFKPPFCSGVHSICSVRKNYSSYSLELLCVDFTKVDPILIRWLTEIISKWNTTKPNIPPVINRINTKSLYNPNFSIVKSNSKGKRRNI